MAVRKLFVSHSSKTPRDLERLREICDGLQALGYHILVDKNAEFGNPDPISPGRDWNLRINEWLHECHDAVILFNHCALEQSNWVRKEAAVLSWRRDLDREFCLIPVLLDGIQTEALARGVFGVMRIADSQSIFAGGNPASIVQRITEGLGPPETSITSPFTRLERSLRKIFQEQADAETLEDAWRALDGDNKPRWQPDQRAQFAEALVRLLLRNTELALEHLQELINRIRPRISADRAHELVRDLACLWVDPCSASGLASAGNKHRLVALNGNFLPQFTAEHYKKRAWLLNDRCRLIPVDQQASRTIPGIQEAIRAGFRRPGTSTTDEKLDRQISKRREPAVVLIILDCHAAGRPQFPDTRLRQQIQTLYPNLIFLFGTGPAPPEALPGDIRLLEPPLDTELESDIEFALGETEQLLADLYPT